MLRDPSILIVEEEPADAGGTDPTPAAVQDHVLVIDDEPDMLGLYRACLTAHGYRVTAAADGAAGLDLAAADPPSAVVLDMRMPGMDGLEVLERFRRQAATADVPILMVSGQDTVEDRITCLRQGVDDFLPKPFEYEELVARVQALIRRATVHTRPPPAELGPDDRRRLGILRRALREGPGSLLPVYDRRVPCGFAYPATTAASAEEALKHDPLADLDFLHARGYLERTFHDVVLVCPFCSHHDIHLREVCPACGSADLSSVEMIHHFRCAHTGPAADFRGAGGLECPKCRTPLRHVGLDHEKPPDTVACGSCGRAFQEPDVAARCRSCSHPFAPEEADRRRIYGYIVTAAGRFAAEAGAFLEPPAGSVLTENEVEVYRAEFFRELVHHEVTRSATLGQSTAVLRIGVRGLEKLVAAHGQNAGRRALRDVVDTIRASVREVDRIGRLRAADFVVLLPGADTRTAVRIARKVAEVFGQSEEEDFERLGLSYAWAVHPNEAADADSLLGRVLDETPTAYLGDPEMYVPADEAGLFLPALGARSYAPLTPELARPTRIGRGDAAGPGAGGGRIGRSTPEAAVHTEPSGDDEEGAGHEEPEEEEEQEEESGAAAVDGTAAPAGEAGKGRIVDFETWKRGTRDRLREGSRPWWAQLGEDEAEENRLDPLEPC
ncbi:MAG: response regulator [Planctomycetes bacterium]|nr:response regulator [Planctomycetota bacterium]